MIFSVTLLVPAFFLFLTFYFLVKYNQHPIYSFQLHNIVIPHLHTFQCDHYGCYVIDWIPCAMRYILVTYLFYN